MIAGVLLAAGGSSRLGRSKQLLRFRGSSLVRRAALAALDAGCEPLVAVLGAEANRVRAELEDLAVDFVVNHDWAVGMAGSIRHGVAQLERDPRSIRAAVLLVCDQPLLERDLLERLVAAFDGTQGSMVACEYGGTIGVPALFERALFRDLMQLEGDRGAKRLLLRSPGKTRRLSWPAGATEIDVPQDLDGLE